MADNTAAKGFVMRQALELALEALEDRTSLMKWQIARDAVKEALAQPERDYERGFIDGMQKQMQSSVDKAVNRMAQPEQEPVAYLCENAVGHKYFRWKKPSSTYKPIALYTTPPQRTWVGLTDEEIADCAEKMEASDPTDSFWREFFRGIEAKLKEKNT
jgi:hypothetical protein